MRATSWLRRLDRHGLELTIGLALLGFGVTALFPLLGVIGLIPPADAREVDIDTRAQVPDLSSGGMSLRGTHHAELTVGDPGLWDRVLLSGPGIVQAILIIVVLTLLMRMATTFQDGDVFVPQNTRRLSGISFTLLLAALVVPALDTLTTIALVGGTPLEPAVETGYTLSGLLLLLAFLAAALAGAFGHGARLRADTEGLV
ncbi:DUF2975 domain-containing protein [Actinomadura sp. 7K507]|uniref:DUF2975 domain-containing protein n=1 Tax=Actinomadura sp. 7K507 TaxID=2530365 RepID=UPI00104797F8|nr:DUF2975 domain-containing protein [Actinomadura sp. 7K507]TDC76112.1 DUF2975 domain-containing protein [Actinomadura sp. 7K507]